VTRLIHIPFLKGQDDTVDPKIAPLGVLKSAKNVRFDKQGRIIKRPGFDAHPTLAQFLSLGNANYAFLNSADPGIKAIFERNGEPVAIAGHRVASYSSQLGRWKDWNPITLWSAPERFSLGRNLAGRTLRSSVAYNSGYLCVCFECLDGATNRVYVGVYDATNMAQVAFDEFGATFRRPRVVASGNYFLLTYLDTSPSPDVLKFRRLDTTSITSGWSAAVTVSTGSNVTAEHYDLAAYDASSALLVHVTTSNLVVAKINTSGALVGAAVTFTGDGVSTIYGSSALNRIMVAWLNAASELTVRSWDGSLGGAAGPTIIDTFTDFVGQPTVGPQSATQFRVSCSRDAGSPAFDQTVDTQAVNITTHAKSSSSNSGALLASKVLDLGGGRWAWMVNKSDFNRTYFLRDMERNVPHSVCCRSEAVDFANAGSYVSEFISYTVGARTFAACMLPVVVDSDASVASPATGVELVRIEFGGTERFQSMPLAGNLYFAGGLLTMFDGTLAHESGFLDAPRIVSATATTGGSLTAESTYQYLLTHHWLDANGQLHLSGVSDPASVTLSPTQNAVDLFWRHPKQTWRYVVDWLGTSTTTFAVREHLWRTEADGTIFHQLTDALGYSAALPSPFGTTGFVKDTVADADIEDNAVVYTQGARGGLSGPLQHDPPPPCRYIWAGKERAIIGGLERSNELRWSKFYFPGEALEFSEDFAFRKTVPFPVRAVASLDDVWVVFGSSRIQIVTGTGPDDTGNGAFDEPKALPSDVGIVTWKSLVEWSGGLFFQGKSDMLYLLPRGIGSPQPQPATQAVLRQYPTVTSARLLPEQNLVVFTLIGGAGAKGALLCFDTENGQWTVDEIAGGVEHAASALVDGRLLLSTAEGTAIDVESSISHVDRGSQFVPVQIETAALRPHGMQADGRTRKIAVLGEYRADCSMKMELSVNDARTYGYSKIWDLGATATAGDVLRREWQIPVQKFGAASLKISELQNGSNANEGFVLHGLTMETRPRAGMPRLRQGYR
jgi:hypothetical protein